MKEKINSFIDMYEELLLLARIQAKSHACKEGYDYETITDVYLVPYGDDIVVTYHVKPQECEFEEDSIFTTRLAIKRFVFETVQEEQRMITERHIKTYFDVKEHLKNVVFNDCGRKSEYDVHIARFSMKDNLVHIHYRILIDDYNGVWRDRYLDIPMKKFCAM